VDDRCVSRDTWYDANALTAMTSAMRVGHHLLERMGAQPARQESAHAA
jgi:hypothetical protein